MAKLHSLIKFKRHELDEKRRILSVLNSEMEALVGNKNRLLSDLAREKNLASVDIDIARSFGPYLNKTLARCEALDLEITYKLQEVQAATVVVQEAYLEVKKLEVTQEKRDQEEDDRVARIESNNLDEVGLEGFRRRQEENLR